VMAPLGFASFFDKASVSRTRRETRCRMGLGKRSIGLGLRACLVMALGCAAGMIPV
jgi:hypothetical protein